MAFFRGYTDFFEFWLFVLVLVFVSALALLVVWVKTVEDFTQAGPTAPVDNRTYDGEKTAAITAANHYLLPAYKEVYRHSGTAQSLNDYLKTLDPYSKYLTSEEVRFFEKRKQRVRVGIGLDFMVKGDRILAVPVAQGPLYNAGMKLPAYLRSINGRKIKFSDFSSYAFLADFPAGGMVRLILEDAGNSMKTDYALKAVDYRTDAISYYTNRDILFIRIKKFVGSENAHLRQILETSFQYKKLVFDLRFCPGGDVYAMVGVLSFILKPNLDVAFLQKGDDTKQQGLRTLPGKVISETPIFLLVSEFTASSAELFSRALRKNYRPIQVLGEPTKGKCLAQVTFKFPDGSALKLTTYEVKDSSRHSCEGIPMIPDRMIPKVTMASRDNLYNAIDAHLMANDVKPFE